MTRPRRLLITAAVLLFAGGATIVALHRFAEHRVRLEVTTRSGAAGQIRWDAAGERGTEGGKLTTPWSAEVTVGGLSAWVTLAALADKSDVVTCRITVDGTVAAEATADHATGCTAHVTGW
ncbi:MmpS family transport accessory protein [Actinoplanes sp. NPDC024001]|uniref:MmpS family transport accessory protein n=1 Tax=Actinoplanes sp. NPDC024001 TaxID=3154598 RepID=UPI0033F29B6D